MKNLLIYCILANFYLAPLVTMGQLSLVKDIFPGGDSNPYGLININGTLFFIADDGEHGEEIWKSDGTEAGTVLLRDIFPGKGNGYSAKNYLKIKFTILNDLLLFVADDGEHGKELWKTDGTEAGTVMVKDIFPGNGSSEPDLRSESNVINGNIIFVADDGEHGRELWKTDGTEAGTFLLKDFVPGSESTFLSIIDANGITFITPNNIPINLNQPELWKSDGTQNGTVMVKDFAPGIDRRTIRHHTNVNETLFFTIEDGFNSFQLWKSDGTENGTVMVKFFPQFHIVRRTNGEFTNVNGLLFFKASDAEHGDELWRSDGTEEGTIMLEINPGPQDGGIEELTSANSTLFFWGLLLGQGGQQLWKSDGTVEGTVLVKDTYPGGYTEDAGGFTNVNGTLLFTGDERDHGEELWVSDGTEKGTKVLKDIYPGPFDSFPYYPVDEGDDFPVYFTAENNKYGGELWKTDGTEAGTVLVADINPGKGGSYPGRVEKIGSTIYFAANDGIHGRELWKLEESLDKLAVESFTLINADNNTDILELTEGLQIDVNDLPSMVTIRANTDPTIIGSVQLQLSGKIEITHMENIIPYVLLGDNNGNYNGQKLEAGNYNIKATPYTKSNGNGEEGTSLSINFSIVKKQAIESFTLINADNNTDILELTEGLQINVNNLPSKLSIRANTDPSKVGSVQLKLSGPTEINQTENIMPYALFGDNNGTYIGQKLEAGNYNIKATPYTKTNRNGEEGVSLSINFSIEDNLNVRFAAENDNKWEIDNEGDRFINLSQNSWVYPNPVATPTLHFKYNAAHAGRGAIRIMDMKGQIVLEQEINITSGVNQIDMDTDLLSQGQYVVSFSLENEAVMQKVIKH